MAKAPGQISQQAWLNQIFAAGQVNKQGIVRRSVNSVKAYASEAALLAEVKQRNFHMVRSGGQYLIFCHQGNFQVMC